MPIPYYKIRIWRYNIPAVHCDLLLAETDPVNGDSPRDPLWYQDEIISFKATQIVGGEVGEATVIFDNEPEKDYAGGDILEIWVGWKPPEILEKVFSGVIYEARQKSQDENKRLVLKARDWGHLLFTDKITASFPIATNAKDIIEDLIDGTLGTNYKGISPIPPCDRKVSLDNIDATASTRTVDFIGESIFDCILKVSTITSHDYYIDENKDLNWFLRLSRPSSPLVVITGNEMEDYETTSPYESLCNKVKVYGRDNKRNPWDSDLWTQGVVIANGCAGPVNGIDVDNDGVAEWCDSFGVTNLALDNAAGEYIAGTESIRINAAGMFQVYINLNNILPNYGGGSIDLTQKESFKVLRFGIKTTWIAALNRPPDIRIQLWTNNIGNRFSYFLRSDFMPKEEWKRFEIPVGPDANDQWVKTGNPSWSNITHICFDNWSAHAIDFRFDWLHFGRGKWYGEDEDSGAGSSQEEHGIKFKEIFEETAYSDTACERIAKEYVKKFKDPFSTVKDVILDYSGQEKLNPGETIVVDVPELESAELTADAVVGQKDCEVPDISIFEVGDKVSIFDDNNIEYNEVAAKAGVIVTMVNNLVNTYTVIANGKVTTQIYRIESITHEITEDLEYFAHLLLSLDPILFPGKVSQISERVRRLEQDYDRIPAAKTTEID